ncbi:MAG: acyl-CoA dehydratase activase [Clostridia bacterium]|nr:acyl-CoA dehydratase activase [Clostridia bacterium]
MALVAGIDVGSLSTEVVLLTLDGEVVAAEIAPTGTRGWETARSALERALQKARAAPEAVARAVATGYGRHKVPFAHRAVTEISCHARGAFFLEPGARTVIDIGGQDSKVIRLDGEGRVVDFVMNDKCAAGTGRFLEVMARALEVEVEDFAALAARSRRGKTVTSTCTVFAESEVVSLLSEGAEPADVARGLAEAVAARVTAMAQRLGVEPEVVMTGGVAKNHAVVAALRRELGLPVQVPAEPQIVGALGAALFARDEALRTATSA